MVGKRHRIWTDIDKDKLGQGGRETELRILGFGNEGIGHLTPPFQHENNYAVVFLFSTRAAGVCASGFINEYSKTEKHIRKTH